MWRDIAFLKCIFMQCTYVNAWRAHPRAHKHYVDLTESYIYRGWKRDIRWVRAVHHKNWTLLCSAVPWPCRFIHMLHIFVVYIEHTNTCTHFRVCSYLTFISALDNFIVVFFVQTELSFIVDRFQHLRVSYIVHLSCPFIRSRSPAFGT